MTTYSSSVHITILEKKRNYTVLESTVIAGIPPSDLSLPRHIFLLSSPPLRVTAQHSHETLVHSVLNWRVHNVRTTHPARLHNFNQAQHPKEAEFRSGFIV